MPARHAPLLSSLAIALIGLAAARDARGIAAPRPRYGAQYRVLTDPARAPRITRGALVVYVAHTGCREQRFTPAMQQQTAGLFVWWRRDESDSCAAERIQRLELPLSEHSLRRGMIFVMTPNAGTIATRR